MTRLLVPAALLALALAAGGCGRSGPDGPGGASTAAITATTVAATASSLGPAPEGWPMFTSAVGYRRRYPPGWRVSESSGSGRDVVVAAAEGEQQVDRRWRA